MLPLTIHELKWGRSRIVTNLSIPDASLTEQLAIRLQRPVDAAARQRAALLLLDWLGCVLGALRDPLAGQLGQVAQNAGKVVAIGVGGRSAADALLVNAALGNVLEMDDLHRGAILHPGPVVIPVALACAQAAGVNEATIVLDAIVRGYEATIRVGCALGRAYYRDWHPTSVAGAFGAAAAACSVLGLSAGASADALGNAGSRTGGVWRMRHEPVPTKSLHNAEAARSGWLAAQLAQAGVRGPRRILEGEQGLFAAIAPDAQPQQMMADGERWRIHATSLKPWPACRHAHPAMDAMLEALATLAQDEAVIIERVEVATYAEALRFCDSPAPITSAQARFSLQHALASILVHGHPQLPHYTEAACADPDVAHWRGRIVLAEDQAHSERFPAHYGATVRVQLADGRNIRAECRDARGDPERPMDETAVLDKARMLAQWGSVPDELAQHLFEQALALAEGGTLDAMNTLLTRVRRCD